jgi:hypothetical protein
MVFCPVHLLAKLHSTSLTFLNVEIMRQSLWQSSIRVSSLLLVLILHVGVAIILLNIMRTKDTVSYSWPSTYIILLSSPLLEQSTETPKKLLKKKQRSVPTFRYNESKSRESALKAYPNESARPISGPLRLEVAPEEKMKLPLRLNLDLPSRTLRAEYSTPAALSTRDPRANTVRPTRSEKFAIGMREYECIFERRRSDGTIERGEGRLSPVSGMPSDPLTGHTAMECDR